MESFPRRQIRPFLFRYNHVTFIATTNPIPNISIEMITVHQTGGRLRIVSIAVHNSSLECSRLSILADKPLCASHFGVDVGVIMLTRPFSPALACVWKA